MVAKANRKTLKIAAGASKLDKLIVLLSGSGGCTMEEMVGLTGWQAHSVRGAIAGAIKKRGHAVTSTKEDGIRRYRIS